TTCASSSGATRSARTTAECASTPWRAGSPRRARVRRITGPSGGDSSRCFEISCHVMAGERTRRLGDAEGEARPLPPGERIDDWIVVRTIGGGGFGAVYEVRHRTTDQRAALKLLHAHLARAPAIVARFDREATVIGRLRHPNVVELIAAGLSDDGRPYLC